MRLPVLLLASLLPSASLAAPADQIAPRALPPPERTGWRPAGCREVPFEHPVLLPRTAFRRAHGDLASSDEVELAYAPSFDRTWVAETSLYQVTTPSFDAAGNLYMTPLLPHEPVLLVSLEPEAGARRWSVPLGPGQKGGGIVPLVLHDPETQTDVVYVNAYERLLAVRADGTILWETPTGLGSADAPEKSPIGLAWEPNADAIVGLTRDGYVFLFDRGTGAPVVSPQQMPGEPTPPRESTISPDLAADVDELLRPLVAFTTEGGILDLIDVLLGGNSEIANNLSVDPRNGRLWIAATAPDEEDGRVDGTSEFGAVYRLDVVPDGDGWRLEERCHRSFSGGSASTPTLSQDGTRAYLGDDSGTLIAIDAEDCGEAWSVPLDAQIFGSVAAASDGGEIYAASATGIFQVFDEGAQGRRGWTASLDLYDVPADLAGYVGMNLLLTGVGANGLLIQAGVGLLTGMQSLPVRTGIAHVDRLTGEPRWFSDALEESLGAMSTGPDGALYLPHAPLRRAFSLALGLTDEPLLGGVSKWGPTRHDLLARDAACAAADRGESALAALDVCPDSARADGAQMRVLVSQIRDHALPGALAGAQIDASTRRAVDAQTAAAERALDAFLAGGAATDLADATAALAGACAVLDACTPAPRPGCRAQASPAVPSRGEPGSGAPRRPHPAPRARLATTP